MAKLERQLGLPTVVAVSLSTMLGAGIFVLPALAAARTGPSVYLAYMAAALAVLPAAMAKSELATAMSASGGSYVFLDRTFGPMVGTVAGVGLWLALLFKIALALLGLGLYLEAFTVVPAIASSFGALVLLLLFNIRGWLRISSLQFAAVVAAAAGLAAVIVLGALERRAQLGVAMFASGSEGFLGAAAFLLVAYGGVSKVAAIADEIKRPERTLPLAMLIALIVATALYAGVSYAITGVAELWRLEGDDRTRPLFAVVDALGGWSFAVAIGVVAVVALASMANAGLLAAARYPFSMSRENLIPTALATVHRRFVTPIVSIIASAATIAAAISLLDIVTLAELASALLAALFALSCLAVMVLRETKPAWYQPPFRTPLYPWMPLVGVVVNVVFLVALGSISLVALAIMGVPGAVIYAGYGRLHTKRRGVVGIRGRRRDLLREVPEPRPNTALEGHESEVVVALLGEERTPELLVEHAAALANGGMVKVAALVEIPEQTYVDSIPEDPLRGSVERRVQAAAEANNLDLRFETIMSRDVIRTIHELSRVEQCRWLVMEWIGRSRGAFTISNPLGWLKEHLACNLFTFHDTGVRYIRRIVVLAEPGPHDALVTATADQLALAHDAQLTLARFVPESASDERVAGEKDYLSELAAMCDSDPETRLLRGANSVEATIRASAYYDLLVVGEDGGASFIARLLGTDRDRLTAGAACSVLRLQTARQEIHRSVTPERKQPDVKRLGDLLLESCVVVSITGSKKELFDVIARRFADAIEGGDADTIAQAMNERERSQNTAIGRGVALPHATLDSVDRTYLGVFVAAEALDYGAPDGAGVDVFFATIGPPWERQVHLGLLALIARLAKQTSVLEGLRAAWDPDEALVALRSAAAELDV